MSNLIAIANYIGLDFPGTSAPVSQNIVTELSVQMVTEGTSQSIITEGT